MIRLTKLATMENMPDEWQLRYGTESCDHPRISYFANYDAVMLRFAEYKSIDEQEAYLQNKRVNFNRGLAS